MQRKVLVIVSLIVILSSLFVATGCTGTKPASPNEPIKITVWVNGQTASLVQMNKSSLKTSGTSPRHSNGSKLRILASLWN